MVGSTTRRLVGELALPKSFCDGLRNRPQRREVPRQVGHEELVDALRVVEVLQPMLAEVQERHVGQDVVGEDQASENASRRSR
jgi:hypothetical protein